MVLPFLVLPFWYLLTRMDLNKFQKSSKTIVCMCVCFKGRMQTGLVSLGRQPV